MTNKEFTDGVRALEGLPQNVVDHFEKLAPHMNEGERAAALVALQEKNARLIQNLQEGIAIAEQGKTELDAAYKDEMGNIAQASFRQDTNVIGSIESQIDQDQTA